MIFCELAFIDQAKYRMRNQINKKPSLQKTSNFLFIILIPILFLLLQNTLH